MRPSAHSSLGLVSFMPHRISSPTTGLPFLSPGQLWQVGLGSSGLMSWMTLPRYSLPTLKISTMEEGFPVSSSMVRHWPMMDGVAAWDVRLIPKTRINKMRFTRASIPTLPISVQ